MPQVPHHPHNPQPMDSTYFLSYIHAISPDLLNLDTDLLEIDLADTPKVVTLKSSAPCTEPPYVLQHTEQAFILT